VIDAARRLDELLAADDRALDRILAVVASVDPDGGPGEDRVVEDLDDVAEGCPEPADTATVLRHVFGTEGFSGDQADYYDPANSLIHRVIERHRGIPLSLAAVAAEVARRRGHDLRPVGLPGHVLLGEGPDPDRWYDPFAGGAALDVDGGRRLFGRFHPIEAFRPGMLAPMTPEAVAVRTLNNLKVAWLRRGTLGLVLPVVELRAAMASAGSAERLELAQVLAALGRADSAAAEFERLAELDPPRADAHRARARALRARFN
jgi:regulator of sirC expression with transglutaminase-like and TPR domain